MGDDPVGVLRCPHSDLASPSDAGKVPFEWPERFLAFMADRAVMWERMVCALSARWVTITTRVSGIGKVS